MCSTAVCHILRGATKTSVITELQVICPSDSGNYCVTQRRRVVVGVGTVLAFRQLGGSCTPVLSSVEEEAPTIWS